MTAIDRFSAALALALATLPAAAHTPAPWFGLADLRQTGAARVHALDGRAAATPARLHCCRILHNQSQSITPNAI